MFPDRFWVQVDRGPTEDSCWLWLGPTDPDAYGRYGQRRAHRIAYEIMREPIPDGLTIDHLCRVRNCVNPAHLEVVDNRTNVLRGIGITAECARKTHCDHGHEFTPENTYVWKGARHCKTCRAERRSRDKAAWRARQRAKKLSLTSPVDTGWVSAWLIERGPNQGEHPPLWLTDKGRLWIGGNETGIWTHDAWEAVRFPSRVEAEAVITERRLSRCEAVEHGFEGAPLTSPVDPECICPRFRDLPEGTIIADLTCPVHGVDGTDPGDVIPPLTSPVDGAPSWEGGGNREQDTAPRGYVTASADGPVGVYHAETPDAYLEHGDR